MLRRLWFLLTRGRRAHELDEEMRRHVEFREAANRQRGLSAAEAARRARVRFGNLLKLREEALDVWRLPWIESPGRDLRQALRRLHQQPGRSLVVVVTLAVGIGGTTAMFSLVDAMLLSPAPWDTSGRLAWVVGAAGPSLSPRRTPYDDYLEFRDRASSFRGLAAEDGTAMAVGTSDPQRVLGGLVSGNYFEVLGIGAFLGRMIGPADDAAPGAPVVVLSHALWTDHFGASPGVTGARLNINGQPFTIVGVAPPAFTGSAFATNPTKLWIPLASRNVTRPPDVAATDSGQGSRVLVIGRLAEGSSVAAADAEIRVIAHSLDAGETPAARQRTTAVVALRGGLTPWEQTDLAPTFETVAIVPLLVLLVACANVANVLLAYHQGRRRELAMRRAIGASRGRLIRQLLAEALVLAGGAAIVGTGTAWLLTHLVVTLGDVPVDFADLLHLDLRALAAAIAVGGAAVVVFGLAPAIVATRFDVLPLLKDAGTSATASRGPARVRRTFVVVQVALALVLLIIAGLFLQSLSRVLQVDPGFDTRGLVVAHLDTSLLPYTPDRRAALTAHFVEQAASLPGVSAVAAADVLPLGGVRYGATLRSEGDRSSSASLAQVSPTYFETLGLPILRGRTFTAAESAAGAPVAVVSASAARALWPATDPLGQVVRTDDPKQPARQVVGVAGDSKWLFLDEAPTGQFYLPLPPAAADAFVVRSRERPRETLASLKTIARNLDPDVPVTGDQTMGDRIRRSVGLRRAVVSLLGVFAAVTLLLASVGIYGVAAHGVSMRTREVGIRMALGAHAADVLRLVIRDQLRLACLGVAAGLILGAAGARLLASFLFAASPRDATVFGAGALLLIGVAAVASYIPARRAARLNPLEALRHD
jgi:putative ABC transport system permease protein